MFDTEIKLFISYIWINNCKRNDVIKKLKTQLLRFPCFQVPTCFSASGFVTWPSVSHKTWRIWIRDKITESCNKERHKEKQFKYSFFNHSTVLELTLYNLTSA